MRRDKTDAEMLERLIRETGLSKNQFAPWVLGRAPVTLYRWLAGGPIPADQLNWLRRIRSVSVIGDEIHIVVRRGAAGSRTKHEAAAKPRGIVSRRQKPGR